MSIDHVELLKEYCARCGVKYHPAMCLDLERRLSLIEPCLRDNPYIVHGRAAAIAEDALKAEIHAAKKELQTRLDADPDYQDAVRMFKKAYCTGNGYWYVMGEEMLGKAWDRVMPVRYYMEDGTIHGIHEIKSATMDRFQEEA